MPRPLLPFHYDELHSTVDVSSTPAKLTAMSSIIKLINFYLCNRLTHSHPNHTSISLYKFTQPSTLLSPIMPRRAALRVSLSTVQIRIFASFMSRIQNRKPRSFLCQCTCIRAVLRVLIRLLRTKIPHSKSTLIRWRTI